MALDDTIMKHLDDLADPVIDVDLHRYGICPMISKRSISTNPVDMIGSKRK